jgi:hypothetical protein
MAGRRWVFPVAEVMKHSARVSLHVPLPVDEHGLQGAWPGRLVNTMPFYLRKSIGLFGNLLKLNFSKHGIGASLGVKGARLSFGPKHGPLLNLGRGPYVTARAKNIAIQPIVRFPYLPSPR